MENAGNNRDSRGAGRIACLDTAKGIALVLVLFGHCFRDSMRQNSEVCAFLYNFVYAFHVPLFFFASGVCYSLGRKRYRAQSCGRMAAARMRAYLLPWFSYAMLIYLMYFVAQYIGPLARLLPSGGQVLPLTQYLWQMLRNENPYAFHLWYLYTVFLFFVFIRLIDRFQDERRFRGLLLALILACNLCYLCFAKELCWAIKSFFQQLTFFLAGVLISMDFLLRHRRRLAAAGLPCALGVAALLLVPQLRALETGGFLQQALQLTLRRIFVVGLILAIVAASAAWEKTAAGRGLGLLGRNSLAWYLYHQPFCCAMLGGLLYDALGLPLGFCVAACFAASLLVPAMILRLVRLLRLDGLCRRLGLPC